jgi:23S rRNA (uracil1939-C5)-methyltransferase
VEGCGGCDLQHLAVSDQIGMKVEVVADALRRLGQLPDADVRVGAVVPSEGYRTSIRAVVDGGRVALRAAGTNEPVGIDGCLVAHPLLRELIELGHFEDVDEVVLRAGANTGERLVVASPAADAAEVPDGVLLVGADALSAGRRAWYHDEIAGTRLRVSARSFFQSSTAGAELLVDAVAGALGDDLGHARRVVDAYAGVGLFAACLPIAPDTAVTAVEWNRSSLADARINLRDRSVKIVHVDVARWRPTPADVVVADPSRDGLGAKAVRALAGTGAATLVLVSCDAAALGRDAKLLTAAGYRLDHATVLDLFPHTHHVEVVSRFVRT